MSPVSMSELNKRIERAKAAGWEITRVGKNTFIVNDPDRQFSWIGEGELTAWADLLAAPELWPEIDALLIATPPPRAEDR